MVRTGSLPQDFRLYLLFGVLASSFVFWYIFSSPGQSSSFRVASLNRTQEVAGVYMTHFENYAATLEDSDDPSKKTSNGAGRNVDRDENERSELKKGSIDILSGIKGKDVEINSNMKVKTYGETEATTQTESQNKSNNDAAVRGVSGNMLSSREKNTSKADVEDDPTNTKTHDVANAFKKVASVLGKLSAANIKTKNASEAVNTKDRSIFKTDKALDIKTDDASNIKTDDASNIKTDDASNIKTDDASNIKTDDASNIKTDDASNIKTDDASNIKTDDASNIKTDDASNIKTDDASNIKTDDASNIKTGDTSNIKTDDASNIKTDDASNIKTDDASNIKTDDASNIKTDDASNIKTDDASNTAKAFDTTINNTKTHDPLQRLQSLPIDTNVQSKETESVDTDAEWRMPQTADWGNATISFRDVDPEKESDRRLGQHQTSDHWPAFSFNYFPGPIPRSPFKRKFAIQWEFDTATFLKRRDVMSQPPKLITWMTPPRNVPPLPEPVRLRVCPDMPCRLTTNRMYSFYSAALIWNGQILADQYPPTRSHPEQVFVYFNNEPQVPYWVHHPSTYRLPEWKSTFNWTWTYRNDSDLKAFYGYVVKRPTPLQKNYAQILAKKKRFIGWMVSHCPTHAKREEYVKLLSRYVQVDTFGMCGPYKCPRSSDGSCFKIFNDDFKFLLAFENAFCTDYITEKFFRYLEADVVLVARGSDEYKFHAPPGTYINTNDFNSTKELADYLIYLDKHPEEYIKILKKKDSYQSLFEDWPLRNKKGKVDYMQYHFEAVSYCEMCRRLWDTETYGKTIPDITQWFDMENCYEPDDLR